MHIGIDGQTFLSAVRPALERQDATALAQCVGQRWCVQGVRCLLRNEDVDVRRVAAMTLGLIGSTEDLPALLDALHDKDQQVNQMAEHAVWSIWFKACSTQACKPFRDGVAALAAEAYDKAIERFESAFSVDPDFGEAYNQCAIAHYFLGQWQQCIDDCDRALHRVPKHFGAVLGKGHCYAQLGRLDDAICCYRQALAINPHMPAIAQAIEEIESRRTMQRVGAAGGQKRPEA